MKQTFIKCLQPEKFYANSQTLVSDENQAHPSHNPLLKYILIDFLIDNGIWSRHCLGEQMHHFIEVCRFYWFPIVPWYPSGMIMGPEWT